MRAETVLMAKGGGFSPGHWSWLEKHPINALSRLYRLANHPFLALSAAPWE